MTALPVVITSTPQLKSAAPGADRKGGPSDDPSFGDIESALKTADNRNAEDRMHQRKGAGTATLSEPFAHRDVLGRAIRDRSSGESHEPEISSGAGAMFQTPAVQGDIGASVAIPDLQGGRAADEATTTIGTLDPKSHFGETSSVADTNGAVHALASGGRSQTTLAPATDVEPVGSRLEALAADDIGQRQLTTVVSERQGVHRTTLPFELDAHFQNLTEDSTGGLIGEQKLPNMIVFRDATEMRSNQRPALRTASLNASDIQVVSRTKHLSPIQERRWDDVSMQDPRAMPQSPEDADDAVSSADVYGDLAIETKGAAPLPGAVSGFRLQPVANALQTLASGLITNGGSVEASAQPAVTGQSVRSLTLQLTPIELGTVNVTLKLQGNVLVVALAAERPQAVQALSQNTTELRNLLEATGYEIGELEIVPLAQQMMSTAALSGDPSNRADNDPRLQGQSPDAANSDETLNGGAERHSENRGSRGDTPDGKASEGRFSGAADGGDARYSPVKLVV